MATVFKEYGVKPSDRDNTRFLKVLYFNGAKINLIDPLSRPDTYRDVILLKRIDEDHGFFMAVTNDDARVFYIGLIGCEFD